jgi:hypothetical protein
VAAMPPVRSIRNQYHGINPHLHSQWQAEGGWNAFHQTHISDLMKGMKAELRPLGYTAELVKSLQIRRYDDVPLGRSESDVAILDHDPIRSAFPGGMAAEVGSATQVLTLAAALGFQDASEREFNAIGIYRVPMQRDAGHYLVAWIELLSPSNKAGGADAEDYQRKRFKLLQSGLVFVELDYLHESAPTIEGVTAYRPHGEQPPPDHAHPYRIIVMDSRHNRWDAPVWVTSIPVDSPLPTVAIPLNAGDVFHFDFGKPYRKTFEEAFLGDDVDYRQFPVHLERYSRADQTRIANRMLTVVQAAADGLPLDNETSLPVQALPLEEVITQLRRLATDAE